MFLFQTPASGSHAHTQALQTPSYAKVMESLPLGFFDILHTGVSLIDRNGIFSYCNRAFIKMYELPEDVIGRNVKEFFPVADEFPEVQPHEQKMVITLEGATNHVYAVLFNYSLYDQDKKFCGMVIESIPCNLGNDNISGLLQSMHTLEMHSFSAKKNAPRSPRDLNTFSGMVGKSAAMSVLRNLGERFALSDQPVLISGESGTGKELVARALHNASPRAGAQFISINCAALPAELIESELFGYEAGSFTGARAGGMKGKFEQANSGTIFLDEIGELPLAMQAKLLRVLENGEIQKIGGNKTIRSNFRLIGATNRDLLQMIRLGKFREDLYHRLCVFELNVPPLRDRGEDVFLLTRFYLDQFSDNAKAIMLDSEIEHIFRAYPWPGNIRELKNTLVYALYALGAGQRAIGMAHLPHRFLQSLHLAQNPLPIRAPEPAIPPRDTKQDDKQLLKSTLERLRYNKALAARELGISRSKLYRMLHKYGLAD